MMLCQLGGVPKEDQKARGNVIKERNENGLPLGTFHLHREGVLGTSLAIPGLRLCLPMQVFDPPSGSEDPTGFAVPKPKPKEYCNIFNEDFKNGSCPKN